MTQPPLAGLPPEAGKQGAWLERDKEGGGQEVVSSCKGVKRGAEGCGEHSLTGGGRGQLQELGSGVVSWAGSVLHKPALAHTQYINCIIQSA